MKNFFLYLKFENLIQHSTLVLLGTYYKIKMFNAKLY